MAASYANVLKGDGPVLSYAGGGPRVRIMTDGPSGSGSCSRGWHILRSQWRDFVGKRGDIPDKILKDMEPPQPLQRPTSLNLNKDGFDRMLDKVMAHHSSESPRSLEKMGVWTNAGQCNNDLRALLGDPEYHRRSDEERDVTPGIVTIDPAMSFFPTDWSNCLTEETIADLILDAYTSAFVDAFLDGAISLVEVSNKWAASTAGMSQSQSEGSLAQPKANRRLRNTSHADQALLSMGNDDKTSGAVEGFTMSGLTQDSFEAWNSRNFHKCKPLDPFVKRIEKATENQRPARRITRRPEESPDLRKYVWPMSSTNFPKAWDTASKRTPAERRNQAANLIPSDDEPTDNKWLLRVGKDGKTTFPYSLVSHKSFLESQPDPILKEKARKIAPLRFSDAS